MFEGSSFCQKSHYKCIQIRSISIIDNFVFCQLMAMKLCKVMELGYTLQKLKLKFFLRNWNVFGRVISWPGNTKNILQVFPTSTWKGAQFFMFFFTFQTYCISQNFQAKPYGFIPVNNEGPLSKCAEYHLTYIVPNGWDNDMKMASFSGFFFQNVTPWNSRRISCKASWAKLHFCVLTAVLRPYRNQNEPWRPSRIYSDNKIINNKILDKTILHFLFQLPQQRKTA